MITDSLVNFIPLGSAIAITDAAVRSSIVDLLGVGVGVAPPNIIGNATVFGMDVGIGRVRPQLEVLIGTAFASGTSLNVAFQAAADDGTNNPDTWTTLVETGAILTASLTAAQILARFDFPPAFPAGLSPRFLSLLFTPVGVFTAGTISAAPVTMVRDDQSNKYAAANYTAPRN